MYEGLEELRKEVARLNAEVEMLKAKAMICLETVARLREELEHLKRKARRASLKEYMEVLRDCEEEEADGRKPS
jgi:regulator of replication initiation timing